MEGSRATSRAKSRPSKSGAKRRSSRKQYGTKASQKIAKALHEMKRGKLRSGGSGRKVRSRKQAIAIGLSEARRAGGKVPANPNEG